MLEELFNLVKGVVNENSETSSSVPADKHNEVVAEATNTVASGLRNMVSGGGLQSLVSLFQGNKGQSGSSLLNNPIVSMMIGHFAGKLMSKFQLGSGQASSLASSLIPNVINGLVNKTNDPNDQSFTLDKLLNSITGGKASEATQKAGSTGGGLGDLLGQLTGGSGSGGGALGNIISSLAGGAMQQQEKNGGGGLMDLIKGFIK